MNEFVNRIKFKKSEEFRGTRIYNLINEELDERLNIEFIFDKQFYRVGELIWTLFNYRASEFRIIKFYILLLD